MPFQCLKTLFESVGVIFESREAIFGGIGSHWANFAIAFPLSKGHGGLVPLSAAVAEILVIDPAPIHCQSDAAVWVGTWALVTKRFLLMCVNRPGFMGICNRIPTFVVPRGSRIGPVWVLTDERRGFFNRDGLRCLHGGLRSGRDVVTGRDLLIGLDVGHGAVRS